MLLSPEASQVTARLVREIAGVREERKALRLTLRALASFFGCDHGEIFLHRRARDQLYKLTSLTGNQVLPSELRMAFFRNERPALPEDTIMAPVRAGEQVIGVMALRKDDGFRRGSGKTATEILRIVGSQLGYRRELSESSSDLAIAGAVLSGVAPKNVIYRVFHQLRRFIDYDHGATLLERVDDKTGRILARQVSWTKGKSNLVGKVFPFVWPALPPETVTFMVSEDQKDLWDSFRAVGESGSPPRQSVMAGSIYLDLNRRACVEVSSQQADFFADKDIRTLSKFLPYLTWCFRTFIPNAGGHDERCHTT